MCTVTYLPQSNNTFILTSNRDEHIMRLPALPFAEYIVEEKKTYFPKDQQANGTWIAHQQNNHTLCLLNGAFVPHQHKPPYKHSRGLMLLDFFKYNDATKFASDYNFTGIEPFTLVIISHINGDDILLHELRWDENAITLKALNHAKPHIWSSVMLYTQNVIEMREVWFANFLLQHQEINFHDILNFHHFAGDGNSKNDLIFANDQKQTVSISCINKATYATNLHYEQLATKQIFTTTIK